MSDSGVVLLDSLLWPSWKPTFSSDRDKETGVGLLGPAATFLKPKTQKLLPDQCFLHGGLHPP